MTKTDTYTDQNFDHTRGGRRAGESAPTDMKVHSEQEFDPNCGCHGCESIRRENSGDANVGVGLLSAVGLTGLVILLVVVMAGFM